ncbi:hypothetical protein [Ruegeria atlantica]|uniref:hypothetical protein n=1 Tax=Ruegeria atlantica TaxID=81569 RepID=UPI002493DB9B|nr:hypothetical protein [Ruegeria atlantica]
MAAFLSATQLVTSANSLLRLLGSEMEHFRFGLEAVVRCTWHERLILSAKQALFFLNDVAAFLFCPRYAARSLKLTDLAITYQSRADSPQFPQT